MSPYELILSLSFEQECRNIQWSLVYKLSQRSFSITLTGRWTWNMTEYVYKCAPETSKKSLITLLDLKVCFVADRDYQRTVSK